MTIRSIKLNQFKKIGTRSFDFGSGLTAIQGGNAAGKTSLLRAVMFALFGPTAAGAKGRLATRGSDGSVNVCLTIDLPVHGVVTIDRTLRNSKVMKDGELIASGLTATTKLIEEAYGMPMADLQTLMFARQGESQALLELGATALQRTVERLAKADRLDRILALMSNDMSLLSMQLGALEDGGDATQLQQQLDALGPKLAESKANAQQVEKQEAQARAESDRINQQYTEAAANDRLRTLVQQQVEDAAQRRTQAEETLHAQMVAIRAAPTPPDIEEARQRLADAKAVLAQVDERQKARRQAQNMLTQAEARLIRAREVWEVWEGVREEYATLSEITPKLEHAAQSAFAQMGMLKRAMEDAARTVESAVCHACKRPFNEAELEAAQARLARQEALYSEAFEVWTEVQQKHTEANTRLQLLRKLEVRNNELADAEREYAEVQALWQQVQRDDVSIEQAQAKVKEAEAYWWDATQQAKAYQALEARLQLADAAFRQAGQEYQDRQAQLATLPPRQDPQVLQGLLQAATQKAQELHKGLLYWQGQMLMLESQSNDLAARLEKAVQVGQRRAALLDQQDKATRLHTYLKKSRSDLMSDLWDGLLNYTSYLVSSVTDGALSHVMRKEGDMWVQEAGEWIPSSDLSGFQASLLGLSLRIAMSRVFFGHEHVLLLDEPTADAEEENAARVAGMLKSLGGQVIYVTHREGDAANADNLIALT